MMNNERYGKMAEEDEKEKFNDSSIKDSEEEEDYEEDNYDDDDNLSVELEKKKLNLPICLPEDDVLMRGRNNGQRLNLLNQSQRLIKSEDISMERGKKEENMVGSLIAVNSDGIEESITINRLEKIVDIFKFDDEAARYFKEKYYTNVYEKIESKSLSQICDIIGKEYYFDCLLPGYGNKGKTGTVTDLIKYLKRKIGESQFEKMFICPSIAMDDILWEKIEQSVLENDKSFKYLKQFQDSVKIFGRIISNLGDYIDSSYFLKDTKGNKSRVTLLSIRYDNKSNRFIVKCLIPSSLTRNSQKSHVCYYFIFVII